MKRIFVYGSLKRGCFNHRSWGFDRKTRFIGEAVLPGARLYAMAWYPCAVMTDDGEGVVRGELYELLDDEIAGTVRDVETGAGFVEREVMIDGEPAMIYLYPEAPARGEEIPGGLWREDRGEESCI